jgi:hypothetical protein
VEIAEVLRLLARQRHQPCLALQRDRRFPAGARAIIERSHPALGHSTLDAAPRKVRYYLEQPDPDFAEKIFKQELKHRLMAAVDYFNGDPVVHTWTYKLDKAA